MEMDSRVTGNGFGKELSLRDVIAPLFRRKKLIFVTFLIVFALAGLLALLVGPRYSSQMSVLVDRERLDPLVSTEATTQMNPNTNQAVTIDQVNSEAQLLLSADVLQKVVVATGLDKRHSFLDTILPHRSDAENTARATKKLAKSLKIKNETNSNLIDVTYKSGDPQVSYAVLNSLGNFYLEKHLAVHRAAGSYQFFANETERYQNALQQAETRLRNFSRDHGVAAPDLQRTDLAMQVATATGVLYSAKQAVAADEERLRSDEAQLERTPQRRPTLQASAQADKLLGELGTALLTAQTKRTQLALKYDPSYPLVQEADREVEQAKAAIAAAEKTRYVTESSDIDPTYELLREDIAKTRADLAAQRASVNAAKSGVDSMRKQMVDLDKDALTQQDLLREAKANEQNYLLYQAKREQERTSDALDKTRIGNVAIAVPPAIPVLPVYGMPLAFLVIFAAALLVSVAVGYIVDYFDSSFHNAGDVADSLGIPVVVAISKKTA